MAAAQFGDLDTGLRGVREAPELLVGGAVAMLASLRYRAFLQEVAPNVAFSSPGCGNHVLVHKPVVWIRGEQYIPELQAPIIGEDVPQELHGWSCQ